MGCFSTCFRKSKRRRSRRLTKTTPCLDQFRDKRIEAVQFQPTEVKEQENAEILINRTPDSIELEKEKLNISGRKKVTFDLNLKVYEELPAGDENNGDLLAERSNEEEEEEVEGEEEEIKPIKENLSHCPSESSSSSSLISFPHSTYRYQNCRDSDDEFDEAVSEDESDIDYLGDDEDDDGEIEVNNDPVLVRADQSSESLSSLSIDSWKQNLATDDMDLDLDLDNDAKMIGLSENRTDGINSFDSVLHPVENLTQWKVIKARAKLEPQNMAKENKISGQECDIPLVVEEPILKPTLKSDKAKNSHREIAVDTSLSTWLAGPEAATPTKSKTSSVSVGNSPCSERTVSPKDFEDRPILGALTVEEIREFSATSTPRRSPSRSPDDMPIIGSVGSYWSHSGQGSKPGSNSSTRSRYMEGRKANSNSKIPFEKRLERAALQKKGTVRP